MKKVLSLALALIMTLSLFAACGEKADTKTPAQDAAAQSTGAAAPHKDKETTDTQAATQDPASAADPGTAGQGTASAPTPAAETVKATIDMTDLYTLVIKNVGSTGDERTGLRAAAGKIEAGTYAANGRSRTKGYEFDFASLGLPGYAWEYLGAEVEIDIAGAEPKMVSTPAKSMFCVSYDEIVWNPSGSVATVGGINFDVTEINYGCERQNTLPHGGGN
jgi:predicted small lipoprotein YifL